MPGPEGEDHEVGRVELHVAHRVQAGLEVEAGRRPAEPVDARADSRCWPVCCCMWSYRRAQSSTTSTSPTGTGADSSCASPSGPLRTARTGTPPSVPRSHGWPPPSAYRIESARIAVHRLSPGARSAGSRPGRAERKRRAGRR